MDVGKRSFPPLQPEDISRFRDTSGWWIRFALFLAAAVFLYAYSTYRLHLEEAPLVKRLHSLKEKRETLTQEVLLLHDMVNSLSDPSADEYALMCRYGKIPEDSKKIIYPTRKEP